MKSIFKKRISYLFILAVIFQLMLCTVSASASHDEFEILLLQKMQEFFGDYKSSYKLFDKNNNDITEQFYSQNLDYFMLKDYDKIIDNYSSNVNLLEKTEIIMYERRDIAGNQTISVKKSFLQKIRAKDQVYDAMFDWTMGMSYVVNHNFGLIMSAEKPTLESATFYDCRPWGQARIDSVKPYTPTIRDDTKTVTFRMDINCSHVDDKVYSYPVVVSSATYGL